MLLLVPLFEECIETMLGSQFSKYKVNRKTHFNFYAASQLCPNLVMGKLTGNRPQRPTLKLVSHSLGGNKQEDLFVSLEPLDMQDASSSQESSVHFMVSCAIIQLGKNTRVVDQLICWIKRVQVTLSSTDLGCY